MIVRFDRRPASLTTALIILTVILLLACARIRIERAIPPPVVQATLIPVPTATNVPTPTVAPLPAIPVSLSPVDLSCTIPALTRNQHQSSNGSYQDTQWAASGLMVCHIERDTCPYNNLVGLLDPTIVFKQEESFPFNTEDVLLHPAMVTPLSRLSQLVLAEWDGEFALRVTDAYDSLLEHDINQANPNRKYSLHFEGRAVDFTTWPVDPSRYGRLCALALCAGFDWVHHEGTHCHASIKAESLCDSCGN